MIMARIPPLVPAPGSPAPKPALARFSQCRIEPDTIALFGSGNSIHDLDEAERAHLLKRCFVITLNYAPVRLPSHLNIWSDRRVADFLAAHYRDRPKDRLLLFQAPHRFHAIAGLVDFWFDPRSERLPGNFTVVWALQLLQRYFPEKRVLLFGLDFNADTVTEAKWYDRYTDFDRRRRVPDLPRLQAKLHACARQLEQFCRRDNVYNCNPRSRLDCFEKRAWQELLPLRIVHLGPASLAGAPAHLSGVLNQYTRHRSTSVVRRKFSPHSDYGNLRWAYDHVGPGAETLRALVAEADVVHLHQRPDPVAAGKPALLQFHSEPAGYRPGQTHPAFNGLKLVVAQYHPRFYTDAQIVPNLIDIWDEALLPGEKPADRVKIFFSWASEKKGGWGDKGSGETRQILAKIKARFGERVEIVVMHNRPYRECLAAKRSAHLCIDECVTGSYHLQSLEGCSVGAATFNAIDDQTVAFLREITGTGEHPFIKSSLATLFDDLCHAIGHPEEVAQRGKAAREWMERYWNPRVLVRRFARVYYDVLLYGKVRPLPTAPEPTPVATRGSVAAATTGEPPARPVGSAPHPAQVPKAPFRADPPVGRPIAELHRRHAGEEIVVFGTGPSLFAVDPDDYREKICLGINVAFEVVPHVRYHLTHDYDVFKALAAAVPAEQCVLPETLVRQPAAEGGAFPGPATRVPNEAAAAWVYRLQDPYGRDLTRKSVSLAPDTELFTWSTVAHSAIHFAAFLGAARITLIGMDYSLYPGGKVHFESRHLAGYGGQQWHVLGKHRQGEEWLTRELARQGVQVVNRSRALRFSAGHTAACRTGQHLNEIPAGQQRVKTNLPDTLPSPRLHSSDRGRTLCE